MERNSTTDLVVDSLDGVRNSFAKSRLRSVRVGIEWSEDIKVDVLVQYLVGMAQAYYRRQVRSWWFESQNLEHSMQRLLHTFNTKTSRT
uniref:Uncharacterized protein n=1 Tax=Peronospora matthiolae TaxID=2874970 RepID=A0AAV1UFK9_9STRA